MTATQTVSLQVGDRVRIARTRTTEGYHFIPSRPGNTGTVAEVITGDKSRGDYARVDLDEVRDGMEGQRTSLQRAKNAEARQGWQFALSELEFVSRPGE